VRPIAQRGEDRNSETMERAAVSRARLPGTSSLALRASELALALGAALFFCNRLFNAAHADLLALDFRQTYLPAAQALVHGHSPYPDYGYPPLVAFLSVPFALLGRPDVLVTLVMIACVPLALWLLDIRDLRCYAALFLWVAVFNAIQTGNVTLPMLVGIAACWRWRDRPWRTSVAGGLSAAAKIIAWPLVVWLAAMRRWATAVGVVVVAAGTTFLLWALLGFSGVSGYVSSLGTLADQQQLRGYTVQALAEDAGLHSPLPGLLGSALALVTLAGVVVFALRGDDARSFAFAVAAVIVASPIVWLHSFVLLIAPLAILRPRFSVLWLLPAALWFVSPGTGNGATWQTATTLGGFALLFVVVLLPQRASKSGAAWGSGRQAVAGEAA
jgi:hypothetical protein